MDAFYANPNLTPTDKIVIVKVMESLGPVGGRELYHRRRGQRLLRSRWAFSTGIRPC